MRWLWRNILISSVLALAVYVFIYYSETGNLPEIKSNWQGMALALVLVNLCGAGLHEISRFLNRSLPWNRNVTARFFIEVFSGIILFSVAGLIYVYGFIDRVVGIGNLEAFWKDYWDGVVKFGILSVVLIYLYSLANFSIFSYNQYAVRQLQSLSLEREQLGLQYDALKSQLSPHFLFNSLNTISSLIYKDITLAENFIRQLAHTYSYILGNEETKLVSLEKELEIFYAFYRMQQTRYGDSVDLEVNLPDHLLKTQMPPLTLQMLLENALKHNLVDKTHPLYLKLYFDEDKNMLVMENNHTTRPELIRIGNNLLDRPESENSHKIGLGNIRSRYAYFIRQKPEIIFEDRFIVKLPIIRTDAEQEAVL